jgi:hypothetical protein
MPDRKQPTRRSVDLDDLIFSAKIDYITLHTLGKVKLPKLTGKPKWPMKLNGLVLTVHDATASDIDILISVFGPARLIELEIAIDVRPTYCVTADESEPLLKAVMVDMFARGLDPSAGDDMAKGFRAFYRRLDGGYIVRPFNLGLPRATDQQLHGGRDDAAQVKGYWKRRDQGVALAPEKQVARVEVRLGSAALVGHSLYTLTDIRGFKFRKSLMPYFRHVRGTRRAVLDKQSTAGTLTGLVAERQDQYDHARFQQAGVGAFLPGGKLASADVRLLRDIPVNHRLGQALARLEDRFRPTKFVRDEGLGTAGNPMLVRFDGNVGQSCMTN